jgi:hypothetical protein
MVLVRLRRGASQCSVVGRCTSRIILSTISSRYSMPPNSVFVEYQTDIIVENRIRSAAKKFSFFWWLVSSSKLPMGMVMDYGRATAAARSWAPSGPSACIRCTSDQTSEVRTGVAHFLKFTRHVAWLVHRRSGDPLRGWVTRGAATRSVGIVGPLAWARPESGRPGVRRRVGARASLRQNFLFGPILAFRPKFGPK